MSFYDTYCAICGCSLISGRIGSDAPGALRRRRAMVAQTRAARERGDPDPKKTEHEEERMDGEDWWSEDENRCYDPTLVSEESLEWLAASRCLGINPEASGNSNYTTFEAVFPFHQDCFDVLTNVLVGSRDVAKIDKDALYDAMSELVAPLDAVCLKLDYGSVSGRGRHWVSEPGEEFSVTSPATTPEVTKALERFLADDAFGLRPDSLGITREPQILLNIFRFLSGDALLALLKSSWPAFCATRRNAFWKWFLKHDMPWLTELGPLLLDKQRDGPELSYKALYLWLDKVMAPRYGMEGPFLSLANRRRIWGVCEQLAPYYVRRLQEISLDEPDPSILEHAICGHMALISDDKPPPSGSWTLQRTLFVYSADEVKHRATIFEAYWGEGGRLVGFGAVVGRQKQRVFGLNGAELPHITRTATRIAASDRVTAITVVIATADPNQATTSPPAVVAILVRTCD
ncbi:hypothetical protein C8A01DRAFT_45146 [Parachaetomium inaequale]|uniref:F-box domain-containing protein n=1 Tax=Parachaetomium inaequale TaxID=2588326 RepID=A0AAN6PIX1_9PEZI|nr:hypothetical protein C8A01DRAFT_45146 [Parachaetomium inaequale]